MSLSSISGASTTDYTSNVQTTSNDTVKAASQKNTGNVNTVEKKNSTDAASSTKTSTANNGVVYEKSSNTKKSNANTIYNKDAVVQKLKADQQSRADALQGMVEKLLNKQKGTFDISSGKVLTSGSNLAAQFRQAASLADPDTIKKAQEDVSEDGYWGVNKTSDRLVSMAIALSGGDTDKADEMIDAIQKGFDKATKAWGEELPDISKQTLEATKQKMNDWKNGLTTAEDYAAYLS